MDFYKEYNKASFCDNDQLNRVGIRFIRCTQDKSYNVFGGEKIVFVIDISFRLKKSYYFREWWTYNQSFLSECRFLTKDNFYGKRWIL